MFSIIQIGVGFELEPQLMFHCMAIGVRPRFTVMSLSIAPS